MEDNIISQKENTKMRLKDRIYFRFDLHNTIWLGALLVILGTLTIANRLLFMGSKADGSAYRYDDLILLFGFTALAAMFCSILQFDFGQKLRRILSWALLLCLGPYCAYCVEWINQTYLASNGFFIPPYKWAANILIYLMVILLLFAATRGFFLTAFLGCAISLFFGSANYFVTQFRGTPILPWDLQSVGTAADMAGGYEIKFTSQILYTVFATLFLLTLIHKLEPDAKAICKKGKLLERLVPLTLSLVLMVAFVPLDMLTAIGISVYPWNQRSSTKMTGVAAGFFGNLQFMMVDKPNAYSPEAVAAIEEETRALTPLETVATPKKKPTVIVVMNESLTDFEAVSNGNISLSQDNMPFIHSLQQDENVISGTAYSSVSGGGTCDSEFEFLTGGTKAFLPSGSKPYQQYIEDGQTSLVTTLESQGYDSLAIHPGQYTAWNRNVAYPNMGFDDFIYAGSFHEERDILRGLTSDLSCYREIIYRYEQHKATSQNPLFVYNVTIQNHGGFEVPDYESTIHVNQAGDYDQANQYLSLIKNSDEDFAYLINYFKEQEEPVIVLMYGDHWPSLNDEFLEKALGVDSMDNLSLADTMRAYQVPYLIWANYPMDSSDVDMETTSMNYLSSLLLRCAGLELTDYNKYLLELHKTVPVITEIGMIDAQGNAYNHGEETPFAAQLEQYSVLQYNLLFDKKNLSEAMFTINPGN